MNDLRIEAFTMKRNMSNPDRVVRALLAIALAAVGVYVGGTVAIVLYVVAAILAVTAVFAVCPLYMLMGVDTCRMSKTCTN